MGSSTSRRFLLTCLKNPGGAGAKPPLPLSHRKPATSSNFTMAPWKSASFPYDLIVEIPYDLKVENNICVVTSPRLS